MQIYIMYTMQIKSGHSFHFLVLPELGGPGEPLASPIFGRSVNPIPRGWADYAHHYHWPPQSFHLPASLFIPVT